MSSGNRLTRSLGAVGFLVALSTGILLSGCGSDTDDRPATWSYIYPAIIEPSCATASCHSNFTKRGGVNLGIEDEGWYQLVCRHFVIPTNPDQSELSNLLNASGARRMPPDFALPKADIYKIQDWIAGGAKDDISGTTCQ
ncbi:MAG TPA: hypothetical protein VHK47_02080 [Polyangia bacterium]|nr:hypothetical protein [Polyangia bacterium]